jgi:hypothetical protein
MINTLDLHGIKHQDVDRLVENFIFTNQNSFPLTIITGNSNKMIKLVEAVLIRNNVKHTMFRYGAITAERFL